MKYIRLFSILTLNNIREHYIKFLFALIGMSTGIAIFVTTSIYKETIYKDVRNKEKLLIQSDRWIVKSSNGRISANDVRKIADLGIFYRISPKSSGLEYADYKGEKVLTRFAGVDLLQSDYIGNNRNFFRKEGSKDIIPAAASSFFTLNDKITIDGKNGKYTVIIKGIIPGSEKSDPLIVTDISAYQEIFGDYGWIDELEVEFGKNKEQVQKLLAEINPDLLLVSQSENINNKQSLSDAFLVNLKFFSLVSLIISFLLIYQFYRFILLERVNDFAKLRAVGIASKDIKSLLFGEIIIIGIISSALGISGGIIFSKYSLDIVTSTINTFYFSITSKDIYVSSSVIFKSFTIGIIGCFLAAIHPVFKLVRASRPLSVTSLRNGSEKKSFYRLLFFSGLMIIVPLFTFINIKAEIPYTVVSTFSVIILTICSALMMPYVLLKAISLISASNKISMLRLKMAVSFIEKTLVRQCIFILSLAVLTGFVISLIIFISSFRNTIHNWIYQVTPADLYIQSGLNTIKTPYPLPGGLVDFVRSQPSVKEMDTITRYNYEFQNTPVQIRASDFNILKKESRLKFKTLTEDLSSINKNQVLISEPFQSRFKLNAGDSIKIVGNRGTGTFRIAGVFYDYISERGAIYIDRKIGKELFSGNGVNGISVYGLGREKKSQLENRIKMKYGTDNIVVQDQKQIRDNTLRLFDKTFRIVWMLAALSVIIAIVTLLNSTLMVYLDRIYELTQLRSLGASYRQLVSIVSSQIFFLAFITAVLSSVLSAGFLNILVLINRLFFGWTIDIIFDFRPYLVSFIVLFLLSYITVRFSFDKFRSKLNLYNPGNE